MRVVFLLFSIQFFFFMICVPRRDFGIGVNGPGSVDDDVMFGWSMYGQFKWQII